jgi:hypothetical protein
MRAQAHHPCVLLPNLAANSKFEKFELAADGAQVDITSKVAKLFVVD